MGKKSKHADAEASKEDETVLNNSEAVEPAELSYEQKLEGVCAIAKPIATKKFSKKLYKLIKKASSLKVLRYGVKGVQMRLRKGETGLVIFAGDVTPIDIMCHLPIVCEEKDIPYIFTPSKQDIGTAMGVKRPCLMVMVPKNQDFEKLYNECVDEIKSLE
uniref:H/ACA ribonucleoprotein complex subunit 2 n=1 Tax=Strigamia maritima TaxID=126957 RepID=T1JMA6_STRMM